ncbi:MAG: PTS sugar transporter subunit IIC, partial [Bacillota bacterium]
MKIEPTGELMLQRDSLLRRKNIEFSAQRYLIDGLGAMALGLFGTLIIGVILETLGERLGVLFLADAGGLAREMMGPGIGVVVALGLQAPPLVFFASTAAGYAGAAGGPVGAWVASVAAVELGKLVSGETDLDIIVTPAIVVVSGMLAARFIGPPIAGFMKSLGEFIMWAAE